MVLGRRSIGSAVWTLLDVLEMCVVVERAFGIADPDPAITALIIATFAVTHRPGVGGAGAVSIGINSPMVIFHSPVSEYRG